MVLQATGPFIKLGPLRNVDGVAEIAGTASAAGLVLILTACLTIYGAAKFQQPKSEIGVKTLSGTCFASLPWHSLTEHLSQSCLWCSCAFRLSDKPTLFVQECSTAPCHLLGVAAGQQPHVNRSLVMYLYIPQSQAGQWTATRCSRPRAGRSSPAAGWWAASPASPGATSSRRSCPTVSTLHFAPTLPVCVCVSHAHPAGLHGNSMYLSAVQMTDSSSSTC